MGSASGFGAGQSSQETSPPSPSLASPAHWPALAIRCFAAPLVPRPGTPAFSPRTDRRPQPLDRRRSHLRTRKSPGSSRLPPSRLSPARPPSGPLRRLPFLLLHQSTRRPHPTRQRSALLPSLFALRSHSSSQRQDRALPRLLAKTPPSALRCRADCHPPGSQRSARKTSPPSQRKGNPSRTALHPASRLEPCSQGKPLLFASSPKLPLVALYLEFVFPSQSRPRSARRHRLSTPPHRASLRLISHSLSPPKRRCLHPLASSRSWKISNPSSPSLTNPKHQK